MNNSRQNCAGMTKFKGITKFLARSGRKRQPLVLGFETIRKPDIKGKGEYTQKQEKRDLKRWEVVKAQKEAQETAKFHTMSDVEPDDPVPEVTDQNANLVKSEASKVECTALSADVPPPNVEPPIVDPIVISGDENVGDDSSNLVEKMVVEDDELNATGAEIAENLWGVRFDTPEDGNLELGFKHPSNIAAINKNGIQELTWRPTLTEMWMDVTDWTDNVGQEGVATQEKGVRPDSAVEGNPPCDPVVVAKSVQADPPLEIAKTVEETEALSLDDIPLSRRIRMIDVTAEIHTTEREALWRINEGGPEIRTSQVHAIMVSLPTVDNFSRQLYTTPSPKEDEDGEDSGDSDETDTGPNGPVMRVTSETIVEVNRRGSDPRLGYGTPFFGEIEPTCTNIMDYRRNFQLCLGLENLA